MFNFPDAAGRAPGNQSCFSPEGADSPNETLFFWAFFKNIATATLKTISLVGCNNIENPINAFGFLEFYDMLCFRKDLIMFEKLHIINQHRVFTLRIPWGRKAEIILSQTDTIFGKSSDCTTKFEISVGVVWI